MILKTILTIIAVLAYLALICFWFYVLNTLNCMDNIKEYNEYAPVDEKIPIPRKFKDKVKLNRDVQLYSRLVKYSAVSKVMIKVKEAKNDKKEI